MIIVRKHIQERDRGQLRFLPIYEYLFYITNDWTVWPLATELECGAGSVRWRPNRRQNPCTREVSTSHQHRRQTSSEGISSTRNLSQTLRIGLVLNRAKLGLAVRSSPITPRIKQLEAKLNHKNEVITKLVEEHVKLKKANGKSSEEPGFPTTLGTRSSTT